MDRSDLLFWTNEGSAARDGHVANASANADYVADADVLAGDHQKIAADIAASGSVEVPTLDREGISFERGQRSFERNDVWGERRSVQQAVINFEVPFNGERDIFKLRPMTWDSGPPRAEVRQKTLIITVVDNSDPAAIKRELDQTLDDIDKYLGWHRPLWENVQADIARNVIDSLARKKQKLEANRKSDDGLAAFGFKPKA